MLSTSHPEVHDALLGGDFAVYRQDNHGFAGVPADQIIEQTVNRDTKTKGGIICFTTRKAYVHRWILSQHLRAAISKQCEVMAGKGGQAAKVKDLNNANMKKDHQDVQAVCDTIDSV